MLFDLDYLSDSSQFIIGCDEVGRGPLAGPVVGAAVKLTYDPQSQMEFISFLQYLDSLGVTDSKKLSETRRLTIIQELLSLSTYQGDNLCAHQKYHLQLSKNFSLSFFIQEKSAAVIDQVNILNASLLAMKEAAGSLLQNTNEEGVILIDGNKRFFLENKSSVKIEAIIKGDLKSLVIALASIIAKVYRDQLMKDLDKKYPGYGWSKNAGYPTKSHVHAIKEIGVTSEHRLTFRGVKEVYDERGYGRGTI